MSEAIAVHAPPSPRAPLALLRPPLPREHGTWAWLLVPALVGLFAPGLPSTPGVLFFVGVLLAFLLHAAMEEWRSGRPRQKRWLAWAVLCGVGFHGTGVVAITHWDRWLLLPLSAAIVAGPLAVRLVRWLRFRHRFAGEALVVLSLSLLAPAVAYASTGDIGTRTAFLWLPVTLYLWSSITCVRLALASTAERGREQRRERWRTAASYHGALPFALAGSALSGVVAPLAFAAFVPSLAKAGRLLWTNTRSASVTRLGLSEAGQAALFSLLLVVLNKV